MTGENKTYAIAEGFVTMLSRPLPLMNNLSKRK